MKIYITFFLFFLSALSVNAQIESDSKKKSITLEPVTETPNAPSTNFEEPKEIEESPGIAAPKITGKLEMPKKEFSMFPEEKFGNPGEQYVKKLDKLAEELRPEGYGSNGGLKEDAFWGDYYTKSKYIDIMYMDHGMVDGDLLRIFINGDIIQNNVYLTATFKGFRLQLPKKGVYKIDFYAINEGSALPNTAAYKIVDELGDVITGKVYALNEGIKATVNIVKE